MERVLWAQDHEVHFPESELIRCHEVDARHKAYLLHKELIDDERYPHISKDRFFTSCVNRVLAAPTMEPYTFREFLVDTGASMHCVGEKYLTEAEKEKVRPRKEPVTLDTASGHVVATH